VARSVTALQWRDIDWNRRRLRCPKGDIDLVFPGPSGRPMRSADLLRTGLHAALRLREQSARGGTDIVTVSKALGHANVHITLTTYAHAIPRERRGAGDALARLMGQSGNKMETWTPKLGIMVRHNQAQVVDAEDNGEVAERLNAPVLKTGIGAIRSRVRISPSPPRRPGLCARKHTERDPRRRRTVCGMQGGDRQARLAWRRSR
jgi:hypothetical protein